MKLKAPGYTKLRAIIRGLSPALVKMAHEGTKEFNDTYDLLYRREADAPNAIWQADHTQLDLWILDEQQKPRRPWLTVVMDDYSRAIAGYMLSFNAPSANQTALALRQAIWRKAQPGWQVCGLPEVLYTDHGSDFTSLHIEQVAAELKIGLVFSAARADLTAVMACRVYPAAVADRDSRPRRPRAGCPRAARPGGAAAARGCGRVTGRHRPDPARTANAAH